MISIYIHGPQSHLVDGPVKCVADSLGEALNCLKQIKGFIPIAGEPQIAYQIIGRDTFDKLMTPLRPDEELHLIPAMIGGGGKEGGIGMILLGAVLIAVAAWNPTFLGLTATMIGMMFTAGASFVLQGLLSFMATPTIDTQGSVETPESDPAASRYLGSSKNTTKAGTRIPIAFGLNKIPGHILSMNISSSYGVDTPYVSSVTEPGTTPVAPGSSGMVPKVVYP